jgi:hypothetical protein
LSEFGADKLAESTQCLLCDRKKNEENNKENSNIMFTMGKDGGYTEKEKERKKT